MGYIFSLDPAFVALAKTIPNATGRGMHADEFDAAFDSVVPRLSRRAYESLESKDRDLARSNPRGDDEDENNADDDEAELDPAKVVVPTRALYEVAMLTTGTWGQYKARQFDSPNLNLGAPHVPVENLVRKNPDIFGTKGAFRMFDPFFERMKALKVALTGLRQIAEAGYRARGKKSGGWLTETEKMLAAVEYVLHQQKVIRAGRVASILVPQPGGAALPFGMKWGYLAAKGNKKLPFTAYSELPMATCPGAGACGVYKMRDSGAPDGYCYSFKSWRYPTAFARQFLNTLANICDREFAIYAASGPNGIPDEDDEQSYSRRVDAAVRAMPMPGVRIWAQFIKGILVSQLKSKLTHRDPKKRASRVFLRLFVDGDINYEDSIIMWMQMCHDLDAQKVGNRVTRGPDAQAIASIAEKRGIRYEGEIQIYGYTKCWAQFVNVARNGFRFPSNYTVNMSNNSVYQRDVAPDEALREPVNTRRLRGEVAIDASARTQANVQRNEAAYAYQSQLYSITRAMMALPITRGYFDVINLQTHIKELENADLNNLHRPADSILPYDWDDTRVADFIKASRVRTVEEAKLLLGLPADEIFKPHAGQMKAAQEEEARLLAKAEGITIQSARERMVRTATMTRERLEGLAVMRATLHQYIARVAESPITGRAIRKEVAKDKGFTSEKAYLRSEKDKYDKRVAKKWAEAQEEAAKLGKRLRRLEWLAGKYDDTLRTKPPSPASEISKKAVQDKALSFLVHEALYAIRGSGAGSCPLVCGTCSDKPFGQAGGVHRCASKERPPHGFMGVHIHIGLH